MSPSTSAHLPAPAPVPDGEQDTVVVLTQDARSLDEVARELRRRADRGSRVVLMWRDGEPGRRLRSLKARVHLAGRTGRGLRARATGLVADLPLPGRGPRSLPTLLRRDPRALRILAGAHAILPLDEPAAAAVGALDLPGRIITVDALGSGRAPSVDEAAADLGRTVRRLLRQGSPDHRQIATLLTKVAAAGGSVPEEHQEALLPAVVAARGRGAYGQAQKVLALMTGPGPDAHSAAIREGWRAVVTLSREPEGTPEVEPVVTDLLVAADEALARDDLDRASEAATLALEVLFHPELHASRLSSPLVDDPHTFLSRWRDSRVGALLAGRTPPTPALERALAHRDRRGPHDPPLVVVVPGTYGQFAGQVVGALTAGRAAQVHQVDLAGRRPELRGMATRPELVDARLRQVVGAGDGIVDHSLREELERADVAFVDWADRGGFAAVMAVPAGVRLVLRIHSMDALSPWIHLMDWSRVGDLILVSEHLRRLVDQLVGDRLDGTRVHVVPNVLDMARIPQDKDGDHRRRLLMIGWAQRVKDPLWAIEVLATLRREDPAWRLRLVGPDFGASTVVSERRYAQDFRARVMEGDVRDAVEFVGRTRRIGPHLAASGFVVSASRRESFGMGLVEGAASGAVPVVRDWPIFAPLEGTRELFPADWVVGSVEEAVERIRQHAEADAWQRASAASRESVAERFGHSESSRRLREIVLGR